MKRQVRSLLTGIAALAAGTGMFLASPAPGSAATAGSRPALAAHYSRDGVPTDTWLPAPASYPSENGLAQTPPMGFNDWANYECDISQQLFTSTADALVDDGLARDGYKYVNVDDCWPAASRASDGQLQADPALFPNGMKWLGDYLHQRGLKFGIYEDAGTTTCGGYPGSWNHWQQDADTFASWGVDYLKLDGCNVPSVSGQNAWDTYEAAYTDMSNALKATGRPIVYSESAPAYFYGADGFDQIMSWVGQEGNLWRFGDDVADNWSSILTNYSQDNSDDLAKYAGPGHWNDPDMLEVGNPGLTGAEQQSQFSLWSEMAAPLLISTDVSSLSAQALAILANKSVIAVDQDSYGAQGTIVKSEGNVDILAKPLSDGDIAVTLFNKGDTSANASISAHDAGFSVNAPGYLLDNLWTGAKTETAGTISASIAPHATAMYRITPETGQAKAAPAAGLEIGNQPFSSGQPTPVTVTYANEGTTQAADVRTSLSAPDGWTVTPASATTFAAVRPGKSVTATYTVTSQAPAPGSTVELDASASYRWPGRSAVRAERVSATEIYPSATPYASLQAAFNNVAITDESDTAPSGLDGGFDGDGDTYSQQALAAATPLNGATLSAAATPGSTVTYDGTTFTWPSAASGAPDNVSGGSRIVALSGAGSAIAFLGSEAGFDQAPVTVTYTDGSTSTANLGFPNWCCADTSTYGSVPVLQTDHRDTPAGPANYGVDYDVFYNTLPVDAGKTVASVTLPSDGAIHVFALALKS